MSKLERVVEKLARGTQLSTSEKDHELSGNFANFRECHIEPDWLLVYRIYKKEVILELIRTGTHSDIFQQ